MRQIDRYKSSIGFTDLLFNILVGFVFLFLVAFLLINPVAKKADILKKAEFIITLSWNNKSLHDMDLWVMDPNGNKVGFSNKEQEMLHLERDDLGGKNDVFFVDGVRNLVEMNEETITIRGISPGYYYVSVHFYSKHEILAEEIDGAPITVELQKINPYRQIFRQQKIISDEGQVINFYRFRVFPDGSTGDMQTTDISAVGNTPKFGQR
jgi:hypothetical protein